MSDTLRERLEQIAQAYPMRRKRSARRAARLAALATLEAVQREAEQHLYTNTKNGNRQAMLNIVTRLRASLNVPHGRETPILAISGHGSIANVVEALQAAGYRVAPVSADGRPPAEDRDA